MSWTENGEHDWRWDWETMIWRCIKCKEVTIGYLGNWVFRMELCSAPSSMGSLQS